MTKYWPQIFLAVLWAAFATLVLLGPSANAEWAVEHPDGSIEIYGEPSGSSTVMTDTGRIIRKNPEVYERIEQEERQRLQGKPARGWDYYRNEYWDQWR